MRFREFKLTEAENNVVVIGDSIAVGIGGESEYAKVGISTTEVLSRVARFVNSGKAKGATVILSSGASNSAPMELEGGKKLPGNLGPIDQQVKLLVQAGAKVALVGVGSNKSIWFPATKYTNGEKYQVDLTGINNKLESIAASNGATFLGPLEKFDNMKSDGIHPSGGYKKLYQAGKSVGGPTNLGPAGAEPGKVPTKDKGQAAQAGTFTLEIPDSNKGPAVRDVQQALISLGYALPRHGADGIRGPETRAAIKKFQEDNGIQVDGDPGPETVGKLNAILKSKPEVASKLIKSTLSDVKQSSRVGQTYSAKPVAYDAVTKGKVGEVLNFVAGPESKGYYDMMFGGSRKPEILKMTINDANKFQVNWGRQAGSSAMGRYQIMGSNTIPYARKAGLDVDTELFSPENQDKMGIVFLQEKGLDQWLSGKMTDEQFLEGLARVWAGIPAPSKNGDSYYGGVGLNKARTQVSMDSALAKLQDIKTA